MWLVFVRSYNWVATGSMDQKLIIWDLSHQSSRCSCEHDVSYFLLFLDVSYFLIIWDLSHQSSRCSCEHDVSYFLLLLVAHTIYFLGLFVMCCMVKSSVVGGRDMPGMAGFVKVRGVRMHRRQGAHLGQPLW
jgi:hypothetical protein